MAGIQRGHHPILRHHVDPHHDDQTQDEQEREQPYWEHGYGTEAMHLLLAYLFDQHKVDRVELDTAEFNLRAQRSFEKCGFKRMGSFTEVNFQDGRTSHKIWMSIDRAGYLETHPRTDA